MRKFKKLTSTFCSFLLAAAILLGSATPVLAESALPPQEPTLTTTQSEALTTPESTVPDDSSNTLPDSGNAVIDPDSAPLEADGDEAEQLFEEETPEPGEPSAEETPEEEAFTPLAIAAFTPQAEFLEDGQAKLSVTLNREDVAVQYQWQIKKPVEILELLYDYSDGGDTSYYFPYADLTEAELLAMNPDATWPGIEMYLAAVDAAGGDASVVRIENGAENTILTQEAATPEWQDITGAVENVYTFAVDEESAEAVYRCVITITDEEYLAQAARTAEALPTDIPSQLITDEASVPRPQIALFGLGAHTGVEQVRQEGPWITGLDTEMEYITADTLKVNSRMTKKAV